MPGPGGVARIGQDADLRDLVEQHRKDAVAELELDQLVVKVPERVVMHLCDSLERLQTQVHELRLLERRTLDLIDVSLGRRDHGGAMATSDGPSGYALLEARGILAEAKRQREVPQAQPQGE